jgi:hypothetical protein
MAWFFITEQCLGRSGRLPHRGHLCRLLGTPNKAVRRGQPLLVNNVPLATGQTSFTGSRTPAMTALWHPFHVCPLCHGSLVHPRSFIPCSVTLDAALFLALAGSRFGSQQDGVESPEPYGPMAPGCNCCLTSRVHTATKQSRKHERCK